MNRTLEQFLEDEGFEITESGRVIIFHGQVVIVAIKTEIQN